jgi:mono/diheme cytochrome c family protein
MSQRPAAGCVFLTACAALCLAGAAAGRAADRSIWDGVYSKPQALRGHALYDKNCAACHGDTLQGKTISDSSAPPALRGESFMANWADTSLQDLHARVRTTMPPATPGSLKNEEYSDILAFVLEQNGFPAGAEALPSDPDLLKTVLIKKER